MKRVVIIAPASNVAQQNAISAYFADLTKYSYWHWAPEVWLVSSTAEPLEPIALRDTLMTLAPGVNVLILRVEPGEMPAWALFGSLKWKEWIRECWDQRA